MLKLIGRKNKLFPNDLSNHKEELSKIVSPIQIH